MKQVIADGCELSDEEREAIIAMYDSEISYADNRVGQLFENITSNTDRRVVFIITGDHGELFGEAGVLGHNLVLHDAVTNVPMVIYGIDGLVANQTDVIGHVDVSRTLSNMIGQDRPQFRGSDLREEVPGCAVSQRGVPHFDTYIDHNENFNTNRFHTEPATAIRTSEFKYLQSASKFELFRPPNERNDISDSHPKKQSELRTKLEAIENWRMDSERTLNQAEFSAEMKNQLERLGYI